MPPRLFLLLLACCCGGLAAQSVGDVLINEVCYDTSSFVPGTATDFEYVELYNITGSSVSVAGWELRDNASSSLYTIPAGTSIPAGGYLVISFSATSAQFLDYFGTSPDIDASTAGSGIVLSNSGDGLALHAAGQTTLIDYVQWASGTSSSNLPTYNGTTAPDPSNGDNACIARVPNGTDGNTTASDATTEDAASSFSIAPFTPGQENGLPVLSATYPVSLVTAPDTGSIPHDNSNWNLLQANMPQNHTLQSINGESIAMLVRYHDTTATVNVSFAINTGQSTVSAPALVLPSGGTASTAGNLVSEVYHLTGDTPSSNGVVTIDIDITIGASTTSFQLELTIDNPAITTGTTLQDALEGQTSQITIQATGGATPYVWSLANEPAWVSIHSSTGQVTMTPPTGSAGLHTFDVICGDANSPQRSTTETFSVTVVESLAITTAATLTPIAEGAGASQTIAASGGTLSYTWSLTGEPGWLSINSSTGALSGIAPAGSANSYNFTIDVVDSGNPQQSDSLSASLSVVDVLTISSSATLPTGQETQAYSHTFTAVGGVPAYTWSATGLPSFLGINPNTGEISGLPTNADAGTYNFDISVSDSDSPAQNDTLPVALVIDPVGNVGGGSGSGGDDGGGGCVSVTTGARWSAFVILLGLAMLLSSRRARSE